MEGHQHWSSKYLKIPYRLHGRDETGVDCWGLVRLVYQQELGILLPDHLDSYRDLHDEEAIIGMYHGVGEEWVKVDEPEPLDGVMLKIFGIPMHVGVMVDRRQFLHAPMNTFVAIENTKHRRWVRRVEGFYRHVRRT